MATIFLSIVLFGLIMAGMAVGLILKGKPIKGSCGGISALGMGAACDICGGDTRHCEKETGDNTGKSGRNSSLNRGATGSGNTGERGGKADFYRA